MVEKSFSNSRDTLPWCVCQVFCLGWLVGVSCSPSNCPVFPSLFTLGFPTQRYFVDFVVFTTTQRCQANRGAEITGSTVGLPTGVLAVLGNGDLSGMARNMQAEMYSAADVVPIETTILNWRRAAMTFTNNK